MPSESEIGNLVVERGRDLLERGRRRARHGEMLLMFPGNEEDAETRVRDSLGILASAMNWLEDTPEFEGAHRELDRAGAVARENFPAGCRLTYENGQYTQQCPAWLAHLRIGMSPGFVVKRSECSVCGKDPEDCEHITGRKYDGQFCHRVITEADLLEISMVDRPKNPDARLTSWGIGTDELRTRLGPSWSPGMGVTCDRCLGPCDGVQELLRVDERLASGQTTDALSTGQDPA